MAVKKSDWDGDFGFGSEREKFFGGSTWELKSDRKAQSTGNVFVEVEQPSLTTLKAKPSGLAVSKADLWAFELIGMGLFIVVHTEKLRSMVASGKYREVYGGDDIDGDGKGDYKGVLIPITEFFKRDTVPA